MSSIENILSVDGISTGVPASRMRSRYYEKPITGTENNYIEEFRKEFPKIRPFEENDWEWPNKAYDCLRKGSIGEAKKLFKKLCLSQPDHFDGFQGMAYVYYKEKNADAAKWFISEAVKKAREFLKDDSIDSEIVDEIIAIQKRIESGLEIIDY